MATRTPEDLYRILQVEPQADLDAIRAAYRRLARLYHPDLNADPAAAERMRLINMAYGVLSDPARRAAYDARRFLPRAAAPSAPAPPPTVVRRVVVSPPATEPTPLQRRVDRLVAIIGVLVLVLIGFYSVNLIPYADRQQFPQSQRVSAAARTTSDEATAVAAVSAPDASHATATVAARLRDDSNLRSFPGTVLVPPVELQPFASLALQRTEGSAQGVARYAVYYGDGAGGTASVSGLIGRQTFDSSVPHLDGCDPSATYCAGLAPGQPSGPPGLELFRPADLVGSDPAFLSHRVCCNGDAWNLYWFDAKANMTYMLLLSRGVADRYGASSIQNDQPAARQVAALAPQLVRLP